LPPLAPLPPPSGRNGDLRDQSRLPYQVALSFNEIAMEVLAWLEERSFEWDMYVDLPASSVRYCFRTLADATAFKQRFVHAAQGRAVAGRH
jgi:hypothetical protein